MLIGCFDESGSSGEGGFVSIAGFVATEERWAAFDGAWNAALAKHGAPYLHTTDLADFKRIYSGWTADQRTALVGDLMAVIWGMWRVVAIGSTMAVDDFNSFSVEQRAEWIDPYYLLLQEALYGASLEARPVATRWTMVMSTPTGVDAGGWGARRRRMASSPSGRRASCRGASGRGDARGASSPRRAP